MKGVGALPVPIAISRRVRPDATFHDGLLMDLLADELA